MRKLGVLALSIGLFPALAFAQTKPANSANDALIKLCDLAASSPVDKAKPADIAGVAANDVDAKIAVPACEAALAIAPNEPRLMFELARAANQAKDYEKALKWNIEADKRGYALATNNLGALYLYGNGVIADKTKAFEYFKKAAEAGVATSMNNVGDLLAEGTGTTKNQTEAANWYRRAAVAGNSDGMVSLGRALKNGAGVTANVTEAADWFLKAANAGSASGMFNYGRALELGEGVNKDLAAAVSWYKKGAEDGNINACLRKVPALRKMMWPPQVGTRNRPKATISRP
jgi:TPR repeat protein